MDTWQHCGLRWDERVCLLRSAVSGFVDDSEYRFREYVENEWLHEKCVWFLGELRFNNFSVVVAAA